MKSKFTLLIVALAAIFFASLDPMLVWAVSVGEKLQPLAMNTNNGTVFTGSNGVTRLIFTNDIRASNGVHIASTGNFTNDAQSTLSNVLVRGFLMVSQDVSRLPFFATLTAQTNNDYNITNISTIVITSTTNHPTVFTGFTHTRDGKLLDIINMTGSNITFVHQNSLSAVSNRIDLLGIHATTTNTSAQGSASFIWNSFSTSWTIRSIIY